MFKWIERFLDRALVIFGAVLFMQLPLFMTQYQHQLTGHVNELRYQVGLVSKAALATEKTLDQFVQKFLASGDLDFMKQGEIISSMIVRWEKLSQALYALSHTPFWLRPFAFLLYFDLDIASSVVNSFEPGIPFTLEGLVYALIGMFSAYFLYQLMKFFVQRLFKKNRTLSCAEST